MLALGLEVLPKPIPASLAEPLSLGNPLQKKKKKFLKYSFEEKIAPDIARTYF